MAKRGLSLPLLVLFLGCGGKSGRMDHPEDPQGCYRDQIEVAQRVLNQYENWGDRAEWEIAKSGDHWEITAWRIAHPDRKGAERYLPWGYSVIVLDNRLVAIHYRRKG